MSKLRVVLSCICALIAGGQAVAVSDSEEKEKWFENCYEEYKRLDKSKRFSVNKEDFWKIFGENGKIMGFDTHYTYHPAWAARCIAKINPKKHVDIGSIRTFALDISAFVPCDYYEYRKLEVYNLDGFESKQGDVTKLPLEDESIESISCMHTIEHIGLGRYGDKIDPDGDLKAIKEIKRVTKKGGNILIVVPMDEKPRICFNAHRYYSYDMIIEAFDDCELVEFAFIKGSCTKDAFIPKATREDTLKEKNGCGCFWFRKK